MRLCWCLLICLSQVDVEVNGNEVSLKMKLDDTGAAFFVEDVHLDDEEWNEQLATSPLPKKSGPVASFGGRANSLNPVRLFDDAEHEDVIDAGDQQEGQATPSHCTAASGENRKGKLNKRKRVRRHRMKHSRKGSKSSLREVLLDDEMFQMEDVNDAEDELGGSEPEIGTASDQFFDQEFYKKLKEIRAEKPKPAMSSLPVESIGIDYEADTTPIVEPIFSEDQKERNCPDIIAETVYVDTSAPTFHYYSDGEDRTEQRPGTPGVFSDSELDSHNHSEQNIWRWGELPNTSPAPPTPQPLSPNTQQLEVLKGETSQQDQKSEPGSRRSWFGWSKSQDIKKERIEAGVYLDDLVNNPELLPKYLNPIKMEASDPLDVSQPSLAEDESASTVDFPAVDPAEVVSEDDCESRTGLSLPMSPQGAKYDSDCETTDRDLPSLISRHLPDLAASLCGGLTDASITPSQFEAHLLTYEQFLEKVSTSAVNGGVLSDPNLVIRVHEKYLTWERAAPILLSLLLYKQPLPSDIVGKIIKDGLDVNINISPEDMAKSKVGDDTVKRTSSWFGWWGANNRADAPVIIKEEGIKTIVEGEEMKQLESHTESSPDFDSLDAEPLIDGKKFRKSLRLTSEQILELNLEHGMNEVQFSVTTAFQVDFAFSSPLFDFAFD